SVLTANPGSWAPPGVTLSYQWQVMGSDVGTDSPTYVPTFADLDKTVSVTVTGSLSGYDDVTKTSIAVVVGRGGPVQAGTVTITGPVQVGSVLTGNPGTWAPAGVSFSYQWSVDGVEVVGATASTYTPVAGDVGKPVSVVVTGSLTNW